MSNADHVLVLRDTSGEWRWRAVAANGEIVAVSEGYTLRWSAKRAAKRTFPGVDVRIVK